MEDRHPYELFLQLGGIEHRNEGPQTSVQRLHRTPLTFFKAEIPKALKAAANPHPEDRQKAAQVSYPAGSGVR